MTLATCLVLLFAGGQEETIEPGMLATIKVRYTSLLEKARYGSKRVARLRRGRNIRILEVGKRWVRIETFPDRGKDALTGWLNRSAMANPRRIKPDTELRPKEPNEKAEGPALAVKGWDSRTERTFASDENLGPQFKLLDRVVISTPAFKWNPDRLERALEEFATEGGLRATRE